MMYTFNQYYIPDRMMPGIEWYVKYGIKPGDFLTAVIENNLSGAIVYADEENLANLPAFIGYLRWEAPGNCWGSKGKMVAWINARQGEFKKYEETNDVAAGPVLEDRGDNLG